MDVKQIRLSNLRALIEKEGAVSQLALRLQISPIYIYRVLDGKFTVGDSMARKIEDAYNQQAGWMDILHGKQLSIQNSKIAAPLTTLTDSIQPVSKVTPQEEVPPISSPFSELVPRLLSFLDNELGAQGQKLTELEKAKLLMKAAEKLLDRKNLSNLEGNKASTIRRISQ